MLIETSAWIAFYRNSFPDVAQFLQDWLNADRPVFTTPVIVQEVLQGFLKDRDYEKALDNFLKFDYYYLDNPVDAAFEAITMYRNCRKEGFDIGGNDCLIAWVALKYDLTIFHNDIDFEYMAQVYPKLKTLMI